MNRYEKRYIGYGKRKMKPGVTENVANLQEPTARFLIQLDEEKQGSITDLSNL